MVGERAGAVAERRSAPAVGGCARDAARPQDPYVGAKELVGGEPRHANVHAEHRLSQVGRRQIAAEDVERRAEGGVIADVLIGKFSFQQNPQKITTYVRLYDEDDVYAVEGFLAMTFNRNTNDLRNKTLVGVPVTNITRLTFAYPSDSSFTLVKEKYGWKINGQAVDSTRVSNYINSLSYTNGNEFVEDVVPSGPQAFSLRIEGNNFSPVELKAFVADTTRRYIITTSVNDDARFNGRNGDLTSRIFASRKQFLKQ